MTYRLPQRLAWVAPERQADGPPLVYLMLLPDGLPLRFEGTGALIWLLAADGEPDVVASVAEATGEPVETVGAATREYLEYLVREGLLIDG